MVCNKVHWLRQADYIYIYMHSLETDTTPWSTHEEHVGVQCVLLCEWLTLLSSEKCR